MSKQSHKDALRSHARTLRAIPLRKFIDDYIYRIDLDADYQREKIWSRSNQEQLIDSILKGIDIPKLYLMKVDDSENFDFECIDGKQRMTALLSFVKPDDESAPLTVRVAGEKYTYERLAEELPVLGRKVDEYELTFVVYSELDEEFLREIFRRLQLGVRLNAGELLKTYMGAMRDFVYKEMGASSPFLRNTKLSDKRFSKPFTLAQICINSFSYAESGEFIRARYDDLGEFFKENEDLKATDPNFERIRQVLRAMDSAFGGSAIHISSRAVAVSAYLFSEELCVSGKKKALPAFAKFLVSLMQEVKDNLDLVSKYEPPDNTFLLEGFQKYVSQASVEPYAVKRRHEFLGRAFNYYRAVATKGRIIRS
jgi:hypothetical protein